MRKWLALMLIATFGFTALYVGMPVAEAGVALPPNVAPGGGCAYLDTVGTTLPVDVYGLPSFFAGQTVKISGSALQVSFTYTGASSSQFQTVDGTSNITFTNDVTTFQIFGSNLIFVGCVSDKAHDDGVLFHDNRLNWMDPHAPVVFYATETGMTVYAADGSGLVLAVYSTQSDNTEAFNNYLFLGTDANTIPEENTLIWSGELNGVKLELWRLSSGAYQFMVGPDKDGNVYAKIFDAMPPTTIENVSFNINDPNHREW